jgi:hypothetical protein
MNLKWLQANTNILSGAYLRPVDRLGDFTNPCTQLLPAGIAEEG